MRFGDGGNCASIVTMEVEYSGSGVLIFSYVILIHQLDHFEGLSDNQVEPRQLDTSEFICCRFDGRKTLPNVRDASPRGVQTNGALGRL